MRTIKGIVLSLGLIGFVAASAPVSADHHPGGKEYKVGVEGMMCPTNCAPSVAEAIESIDGVESAEVDFDAKQVTVKMAPGKTLSEASCNKAFGNKGYFVTKLEESSTDKAAPAGS